jgi:hypothetical protein
MAAEMNALKRISGMLRTCTATLIAGLMHAESLRAASSGGPTFINIETRHGSDLDPYAVWKDVSTDERAEQILRLEYASLAR